MQIEENVEEAQSIEPGAIETESEEVTESPSGVEEVTEEAEAPQKLSIRETIEKAVKLSKGEKEETKPAVVSAPLVTPPRSFPKNLHSVLPKLSPDEQRGLTTWLEERDRGIEQKLNEASERVKSSEPFNQISAEYADYFKATRVAPEEGFKNLITADLYLQQDPIGALKWLAESKGIKIKVEGDDGRSYAPQLQRHNIANNQRLARIEQVLQNFVQTESQKSTAMVESEIESFINKTDANGEPVNTYLHDDELKTSIGQDMEMFAEKILKAHPKKPIAEILEEAYKKAIRANDTAWEREQKRQESVRKLALQKQAKAAKVAGSSVRGSPSGSTEFSPEGKSRREVIAHLYRQGK